MVVALGDETMWCGSPRWTTITEGLLGTFPDLIVAFVPLLPIPDV